MPPDSKKSARKPILSLEELHAKQFRAKCKFKAAVRFVIRNLYWLQDSEDEELGDDVQKNIYLLTHKRDMGLILKDKALLNTPNEKRTEADKIRLNGRIGGFKCFRKYPAHVKTELAGVTCFVYYGPGRVIVRQGDEAESLYFIISGEVIISQKVYDPGHDVTNNQEIGRAGRGGMFGEVSLLHGVPRTATVTTQKHCEFLRIQKKDFDVVLKATLEEQWDRVKCAMSTFTYFRDWDEIALRECCLLSKMINYVPDEVILGDGLGHGGYVYFVLKGECRLIHQLLVTTTIVNGQKCYKLYKPPDAEVLNEENDSIINDINNLSNSNESSSKTSLSSDFSDRKQSSISLQSTSKALSRCLSSKISTRTTPANVEIHFMEVCVFYPTTCFSIGENLRHRRVISTRHTECLLIPRYWLIQKNAGNIWNRIKHFLNTQIPSHEQVFKEFVNNKKWLIYRKKVVDEILSRKKSMNGVHVSDIPYFIRVNDTINF